MRVVLCPDKFRGTATAADVARALSRGIRAADANGDVHIVEVPIADGGEGTVDVLTHAGWDRHAAPAHGPTGAAITAEFATRDNRAVVELARASGRQMIDRPDPLVASTFGTGELLRAALDLGCDEVVLGLGGSATNDGGAGLLAAVGAQLLDDRGEPIPPGGGGLAALDRIDLRTLDHRLEAARIVIATDVDNPLLGPHGAVNVFAAQKGADAGERRVLEHCLSRFAEVLTATVGRDHRGDAGAGAAGGTGFGALAGLGARRVSGVEFVLAETGVERALRDADVVVVGEGRLDAQSLAGKAPLGVAELARRLGVRVVAVVGEVTASADDLRGHGIDLVYSLVERAGSVDYARTHTHDLLEALGAELVADLSGH